MARAPIGTIRTSDKPVTVIYTVDVNAHVSGDLLAQPMRLEGVSFGDHFGPVSTLMAVSVLDKDDQGEDFTVIFHKAYFESCGTLNDTPAISDGVMESYVGFAQVTTWEDAGAQNVSCDDSIGLTMETDKDGDLYAWLLSKGTGTYAGGKIRVTFTFLRS